MLLVGLTGGIAAGKSCVAELFRQLGAAVIDADALSREVAVPGSPTLRAVVEALGPEVLDAQGRLDRAALGRRIFVDVALRKQLEAIMHPAIVAAARERIAALARAGAAIVVYEAALLVETGRYREMDVLVVVVAKDEVRRGRLMARDALSPEEADRRLQAQLGQQEKAALADYIVDNSGSLEETSAQVGAVWQQLQARS